MRVVLQDNEGQVRNIVRSLTKNTVEPESWYVGRVELRGEDISKDGGYRVSLKSIRTNTPRRERPLHHPMLIKKGAQKLSFLNLSKRDFLKNICFQPFAKH